MSAEERVEVLRAAEPNSWIALSGDEAGVVGRGATLGEAIDMAERSGESDPILIKTPEEWVPRIY